MTIYAADPSMLGARYFGRFPQIQGIKAGEDESAGMQIALAGGSITLNFMPPEDMPDHLDGLAGYCAQHLQEDQDKLAYVLSRVSQVRIVLACVADAGLADDAAVDFVSSFAQGLNAMLFVFNSLYDFDGACLVGPGEG